MDRISARVILTHNIFSDAVDPQGRQLPPPTHGQTPKHARIDKLKRDKVVPVDEVILSSVSHDHHFLEKRKNSQVESSRIHPKREKPIVVVVGFNHDPFFNPDEMYINTLLFFS